MSEMFNTPSGPLDEPTRLTRMPTHDNDIQVGEYYYGVYCGMCSKTNKYMKLVNTNLVGGRIAMHAMDPVYDIHQMKDSDLSNKRPKNAESSFHRGGVKATPTWFWSDGLSTVGGPYDPDTGEVNRVEMAEYLCVRAAKCYLKETHPHFPDDQVHEIVGEYFGSHVAEKIHRSGERSHDPYSALREITMEFR